jgi:uncharacterized repeat protein (TIGR03803 family)
MHVSNCQPSTGLFLLSAWLLSACGGGGGSSSPNAGIYSVGGALSGLASGTSVVLQNNGGNSTTVSANGSFTFSAQVASGLTYTVSVLTQPTGQTCVATAGSGTISSANVTSARVNCTTNAYTISGTVSGLDTGAPVTLLNNGGDPTTIKSNGSFSFVTPILYDGGYAVTVSRQPPAQACTVTGGTGSGVRSNVSAVNVACVAAAETVMHTFDVNADGINPHASVVQGSDGNFYGTTYQGGVSGLGTVFKVSPSGVETILHSFAGGATDGTLPTAALIQGSDGDFYGTTGNGGPTGAGTVFKITSSGVLTLLYAFTGNDGIGPSALVQGSDGNFYGTTSGGGPNFNGTVFKLTPTGTMTILYSFMGGNADGSSAQAALIEGTDGNFYGTTSSGGPLLGGTVFQITPAGVETVLHFFAGGNTDGSSPYAALVQGGDGNFYGTTYGGGANNAGTAFKITPAGLETLLHSFAGGPTDGGTPQAALTVGRDGNFYGTTSLGGTSGNGTVVKITPAGVETVLYSFLFNTSDGRNPQGSLIQGSDGNLYGTTNFGGVSQSGSMFKLTPAGIETVVYSFASGPEGQNPVGLVQGSDGNFYGTTGQGGINGVGTVFQLTPDGIEKTLYSFAGGATDGSFPAAGLVLGNDGNFYGTTTTGGTSNNGTVFKVTPSGAESVLHSFAGGTADGNYPYAALILGKDGNFYGTTAAGGAGGNGTVFKITAEGAESIIYAFAGGATDGSTPHAALIQGSDGDFYGTTQMAGANGVGTVFKVTPTGTATLLHSFFGGATDALRVQAALTEGSDGNFYGSSLNGGANGYGTVFKVTPAGVETLLYSFAGGVADGFGSSVALIQASDGNFYGATGTGGPFGAGTLFRVTPSGSEKVIYSFEGGSDGSGPSALIQGVDGVFYGTTANGGSSNLGTAFKF